MLISEELAVLLFASFFFSFSPLFLLCFFLVLSLDVWECQAVLVVLKQSFVMAAAYCSSEMLQYKFHIYVFTTNEGKERRIRFIHLKISTRNKIICNLNRKGDKTCPFQPSVTAG